MDALGRYYTSNLFSTLLVSNITAKDPAIILELGAGGGSLLKAAKKRWINAAFFATEIDGESINNIKKSLPFVNLFHDNSLDISVPDKIRFLTGGADVAICNPPYLRLREIERYYDLFDAANLPLCRRLNFVTSDIIFFAQNLTILKDSGQLGIILPDSLITGKDFAAFRQTLLENHAITKIIELPENIFPKTEALTHILIVEKGNTTRDQIKVLKAEKDGRYSEEILVKSSDLINRMDYKYHSHVLTNSGGKTQKTLSDFMPEIKRGSVEQRHLREQKISQIHTTTMIHGKADMIFKKGLGRKHLDRFVIAQKGDILLARVGRGCMGKVCMVDSGEAVVSDCIYRIRVAEKHKDRVFEALRSFKGQEWIKAIAHGVCAKVLSKSDVLQIPID